MGFVRRAVCCLLLATTMTGVSSAAEFHLRIPPVMFPLGRHIIGEGSLPDTAAIGDVTGDGKPDVVMATREFGPSEDLHYTVFVYAQGAGGALLDPVPLPYDPDRNLYWGATDSGLALAHLNDDARLDIVVGYGRGIAWLTSRDDGGFALQQMRSLRDTDAIRNVVSLDVDLDGDADIVAHHGNTGATIFFGDGQGNFTSRQLMATPVAGVQDVKVADVTNDGYPDLVAVSSLRPTSPMWIVPHDGKGGFSDPIVYEHSEVEYWPFRGLAVGDWNNDGRIDVALSEGRNYPAHLALHWNLGHRLSDPVPLVTWDIPSSMLGKDLDGNGVDDILLVHHGWQRVARILSDGHAFGEEWTYAVPASTPASNRQGLAAGDINSDGCTDVAMADDDFGLMILYGYGCRSMRRPKVIGDFDGDGKSDVLWRHAGTGANVIWRSARAELRRPMTAVTNLDWTIQGIGDIDGDRKADVFWRNVRTGANVAWRSADSTTQTGITAVRNTDWSVVGMGDFDGDDRADLFWRNGATGANVIWRSANSSQQIRVTGVTNLQWRVAGVGDFDGDGRDDVFWRNDGTGTNVIWKAADASAQQVVTMVRGSSWTFAGVGDFDGDDRADLAWYDVDATRTTVWGRGDSEVRLLTGAIVDDRYTWRAVWHGDYDGDGRSDALFRNLDNGDNRFFPRGAAAEGRDLVPVPDQRWQVAP